ncbi:lysophospholipase L1-like esterase [Bradyrhizobium sp. LB7.2]
MAGIFNDQRVVGICYVPDGTTMYNGRPVVGVVAVADGLFLVDNQRVVGGVEITDGSTFYNDQPVLGAVLISDGRKLYNNQLVTPLGTVGDIFAGYPLTNLRAGLANSKNGTAKTNVLLMGDSTTVGQGSNNWNGNLGPGVKTLSWPTQLGTYLAARGYNVSSENYFADFGYGSNAPVYDPRFVLGSWAFYSSAPSASGFSIMASATTATPASFTPSTSTDTCEIYYLVNPALGSFNASINGGANTLISTAGPSNKFGVSTISGTLGMNTYSVAWASGGAVDIVGFNCYDSSKKPVCLVNIGRAGTGVSYTANNPFSGLANNLSIFNASGVFMELGINDWRLPTDLTVFQSAINTIIAAKPASADMIWLSPISSAPTVTTQTTQDQYTAIIRASALAATMPYVDFNAMVGGYAGALAKGFMFGDGIHGNGLLLSV